MKEFFMLCVLLFGSSHVFAQKNPTGFLDRAIRLEGVEYKYQVYVPREFTVHHKWPVILFLHGAGERGTDGLKQTQVGLGSAVRMNPERFPAVIVFPQIPLGRAWVADPTHLATSTLNETIKEFHGDPDRIYLTGLSMGGYGCWYLAFENPKRFAAIVPVCSGIIPPANLPELKQIPATVGVTDPYTVVAERVKAIPTWVFHGSADDLIPVSESRKMVEALKRLGATVRYTEFEGVEHNSWDRAYAESELWTWLFSQRRNSARSGI
jgi:predicted peptidase